MPRVRRRVLVSVVALLPLLSLPLSTVTLAGFLCRMDGAVRPTPCCPTEAGDDTAQAPHAPTATLTDLTCCQRLELEAVRTPSEPLPLREDGARALPVVRVHVALIPWSASTPILDLARAPARAPDVGRPVLLQKQSFLI